MMPTMITVELLQANTPCPTELDRFTELFPHGMEVTRENLQKCFAAWVDVDWGLRRIAWKTWQRYKDTLAYESLREAESQVHRSIRETYEGLESLFNIYRRGVPLIKASDEFRQKAWALEEQLIRRLWWERAEELANVLWDVIVEVRSEEKGEEEQ